MNLLEAGEDPRDSSATVCTEEGVGEEEEEGDGECEFGIGEV